MNIYSDKTRVSADVQDVLRQINSLQPAVGQLVHNDGRSSTLLQLHGTVPIFFKGAQYNIPIAIWIVEKYPMTPPTCYVTPTKEMRIKQRHRHVDVHGMIYLPYLNQWNIRSTIVELITFMSSVFSEDPPVYKHNAAQEAQQQREEQARALQQFAPPVPAKKEPTKEELEKKHKEDLIEAVTVKLQKGLAVYNKAITSEIDSLFEKQRLLASGGDKITAAISATQTEKERILEGIKRVDEQTAQMKAWLSANEGQDKTNVDDVVFPKDTWSNQMFDLVAEDHAIEDTLYQLDRALGDDRIELDAFLKEVRKLARRQFMARALAIKVVENQRDGYTRGTYGSPPTASVPRPVEQHWGPPPAFAPVLQQQSALGYPGGLPRR